MAFKVGDKYYHRDYESGELVEISKSTYDAMNEMNDYVMKKINPDMKVKGTIMIIGTMQDEENNDYRNLWEDNNL